MSKKPCSISFKSAGDGVPCTTVINGKLVVKGDAVFNKNVTTKKDLNVNNLIFSTETIDESGEEVSSTKSLSFINTNGVGELDDACCDGFYKKIVKIIDGVVTTGWTSISGNTADINEKVRIITFGPNGEGPYIGGEFDNVAGITGLNGLAKWTGNSWTSISGNTGDITGIVYSIVFDKNGDGPYIGGFFDNVGGITGLNKLAKWTGNSWTSVGNTGDIGSNSILSIAFHPITGEGPYIGGLFVQNIGGIIGLNNLAKWTGSSWTSIDSSGDNISFSPFFATSVNTIVFEPSGEGPYIGGVFSNVAGITGLDRLAKWGGASVGWTSIGNTGDFNGTIYSVAFDQNGDGPYIGGENITDIAGITGLDNLAKWTGSSWTSISGNTADSPDIVYSIAFDGNGDGPYIGGRFQDLAGITGLDRLAKWTGSSWTSVGNTGDISDGLLSNPGIYTISFAQNDNGPYIGGGFDIGGFTGINNLAKYNLEQKYELTYNTTETLTLTNKGDEATLIYNSDPTAGWVKLT